MIFSDSPQQRALERLMTAVPRFLPQGGGTMVRHYFAHTAEMCDCRYCRYYCRKCTADSCPCIEERILAGAASRSEAMKDIHNAAFHRRLNQFIRESEELPMNFRNEKHRLAFDEAVRKCNKKNFALIQNKLPKPVCACQKGQRHRRSLSIWQYSTPKQCVVGLFEKDGHSITVAQ